LDLKEAHSLTFQDEINHWWIKTRFLYIDKALELFKGRPHLNILEYGTGTGQNLWFIRNKAKNKNLVQTTIGIDPNLEEQYSPSWKSDDDIFSNQLDYAQDNSADLILAMDVLEHIEGDKDALKEWKKKLKDDGFIFITVPAFQCLWSYHDEFLDHKRRYTKASLERVTKEAGFEPVHVSYAFSYLFPLVYLVRKILKSKGDSDLKPPHPMVNGIFYFLGFVENIFGGFPLFGTSVVGVFKKGH